MFVRRSCHLATAEAVADQAARAGWDTREAELEAELDRSFSVSDPVAIDAVNLAANAIISQVTTQHGKKNTGGAVDASVRARICISASANCMGLAAPLRLTTRPTPACGKPVHWLWQKVLGGADLAACKDDSRAV
jgi:hypothetical protein